MFGAYANVVKGGNRLLEIKAHVVCRDSNGQPRWEEDCVTQIQIPCGDEIPKFVCEGVTETVKPKEETPWA